MVEKTELEPTSNLDLPGISLHWLHGPNNVISELTVLLNLCYMHGERDPYRRSVDNEILATMAAASTQKQLQARFVPGSSMARYRARSVRRSHQRDRQFFGIP